MRFYANMMLNFDDIFLDEDVKSVVYYFIEFPENVFVVGEFLLCRTIRHKYAITYYNKQQPKFPERLKFR